MRNLLTLAMAAVMMSSCTSQSGTPQSPNGKIRADIQGGSINILYQGQPVLDIMTLGLTFDSLQTVSAIPTQVVYDGPIHVAYDMPVGKKRHYTNEGNAYTLRCETKDGEPKIDIQLQIYNDGVAYRYVVDSLDGNIITDEITTYNIPDSTSRWIQRWSEAYEDFFPHTVMGDTLNHKWGYPALIEPSEGVFALISEADIKRGHWASYLTTSAEQPQLYKVSFDVNGVEQNGEWISPWRTVIVGDLATVVESSLITDVSTPTSYDDISWIHPGSVSWIYWAYNHGSNDYQIIKKYIDMAAELSLPYMLIDAEWDEMANGGTIDDAIAYAHDKGVKPLLWYNSETAWPAEWGSPGPHGRLNDPQDREREFAWLDSMGVAGVKIDFFAGDKQETMDYCIDLLESAARHHLLVNFHGATIPRGWQRTYPNLMTVEGVYGAEWYNNRPTLTHRAAAHNATLPYTRNVIGPMDYTPCTFSDSQHPHITTNAHELALPVIFESALTHWADRPESYLSQPEEVQGLIATLPTVWDETRLIGGYPGQYVLMARRSGDTWYVAAINGLDEPQQIAMTWPMMAEGESYTVVTFSDPARAEDTPLSQPSVPYNADLWDINSATKTAAEMPESITMAPRGGYIAVIKKQHIL